MRSRRRRSDHAVRSSVLLAARLSVVGVLPLFLVGGLGLQIARDLEISVSQVGLSVSTFFLASTVAAAGVGRVVERIGPWRGMRFGAANAGASSLMIFLSADFRWFVAAMALGGCANAFTAISSSAYLVRAVPRNRQGLAFGTKQAAIPTALMIGGLSVPAIGLTIGWRWAFLLAAGASVAAFLSVRLEEWDATSSTRRERARPEQASILPILAIAAGFGSAAAATLSAFFVVSAVDAGVAQGLAGILLATGSGMSILVRVGSGVWADRREAGRLLMVSGLLLMGAVGIAAMATMSPSVMVVASIAAFAGAWGWAGLVQLVVTNQNPSAPATAAGIAQTGVFAGGVVGPALFGIVAERSSYSAAWLMMACIALLASTAVFLFRRMVMRRVAFLGVPATLAAENARQDR